MILRLLPQSLRSVPTSKPQDLRSEGDVEQKFIYPLLTSASFVGLPPAWVRTKEYLSPTSIDKSAGKSRGYVPDYAIWVGSLPLAVVEAKEPEVAVAKGLREAFLYASEINKRYPSGVNPIRFVLASNGRELAISDADSEASALIFRCEDVVPGSAALDALVAAIGRDHLEELSSDLNKHFRTRVFQRVASDMGGPGKLAQQLGVNAFAENLYPAINKYFAANADDTPDDVVERAYVATDEIGQYEGLLEIYLKDRGYQSGNAIRPIETSKHSATGISEELRRFSGDPTYASRVQLIVGSVGAGKSTFIRRYYRQLMSPEVRQRTHWAFINFNVKPPDGMALTTWIAERFVESFATTNAIDIYANDEIERVFGVELNRFERGPNKPLAKADPVEYAKRRADLLLDLSRDPLKVAAALSRHYSGERHVGIVVVFDNVDRRSRDDQLEVFEAAQWFKELTRGFVLVNLRDTTFEAHKDEPPLDAFANAINYYIRPPRFAQVIRKRLELAMETMPSDVEKRQQYSLASGYVVTYPASQLGDFLLTIYLSLFDRRTTQVAATLEALVAKDVRRALGMFADILVSPHITAEQFTGTLATNGNYRISEHLIIRTLMRGRYKYFNGTSVYIRNILTANPQHNRPSNFLYTDILEYLILNRKNKVDFAQEGYVTAGTIVRKMSQLGYDEDDALSATGTLVEWGLLEPESLTLETLRAADAVRVHASGFIHMRFILDREEYVVGVTPDMSVSSGDVARQLADIWNAKAHAPDLGLSSKRKVVSILREYFEAEYRRRCGRHAFYADAGLGGKAVLAALTRVSSYMA